MRYALVALAGLAAAIAPAAGAVTVQVGVSESFQEKLEDDYGLREIEILQQNLTRKVERAFEKAGVKAERVVITIEDARPNRPTFQQLGDKVGLDPIRSFGTGGAKVTGVAYDAAGNEVGRQEYRWYETDIRQSYGVSTWHDANYAFTRFANKFADKLA